MGSVLKLDPEFTDARRYNSFKSLTSCDKNSAFQVQDEQWQKVDGFTTEQNSHKIYYTSVHTFSLARRHGCLIQRRFAS